jgi:DNA polymerase
MARARAAGLPGSLDGAAKALGSPVAKDLGGHRLMLQMCKPRRIGEDGSIVWWDDDERLQRLSEYCADDVRVERWLDCKLPDLSNAERQVWLADQRLNDAGVPIDVSFCRAAAVVATAARKDLDKRMRQVTGGEVAAATNVAALVRWLQSRGVVIEEPNEEDEDEGDLGEDQDTESVQHADQQPGDEQLLHAERQHGCRARAYIAAKARQPPDALGGR